jgi:urea transport system permease protein
LIGGLVLAAFLFAGSRVGPLYVGLVTVALAYVTQQLAGGWNAVGAANGLAGLPLPTIGSATVGTGGGLYYCALMLLSGAFALRLLLTRSQFGLVMTAVRDDEERAEYFGYRRTVVQGVVLTVSAWLAHDRRRPRPENTSRRRAGTRSGRSRARPSDHT